MKMGGDGFDVDDEYARFRRRQRIHRMHLVGHAVFAPLWPLCSAKRYAVGGYALILIGMIVFWR